jgi:hypothetical protein
MRSRRSLSVLAVAVGSLALLAPPVAADHDDLVSDEPGAPAELHGAEPREPDAGLEARDASREAVLGQQRSAEADGRHRPPRRDLQLRGRGERLEADATTDIWAHRGFAYTGTFESPCGGDPEAGVWVWNVRNPSRPRFVGVIPSPEGSRSNDVKVATLGGRDILVHSNEPCAGGPGGFEIYDVSDPRNPVHLARVQTDDVNPFLREEFGIVDVGVHNLFLWNRDGRDYVAAVVESEFGNFQVFDITDPAAPQLAGYWGAEQLRLAELGMGDVDSADLGEDDLDLILDLDAWLFSGFGLSQNRFLHDITVTADGSEAYLSNWDAGLVLLDIADPSSPSLVSVALDEENGSLDGEVNSHAAWPSEDGSLVVETEEDFDAWVELNPPGNLTFGDEPDDDAPLPGTAVSTSAGDAFEGSQTGNEVTVDGSSVVVDAGPLAGEEFPAIEFSGDQPAFADVGPLTGEAVWIGQACEGDPILNAEAIDPGDIAVVRRGGCSFRDKNFNAAAAGASAAVIANNLSDTPWGGVRVWDYSDPANPVLASTFNTACSAAASPIEGCDPAGTYSVHNVVVERQGRRTLAYISWYWDGMLVLDVTDPYNPVEVARFVDNSPEFIERNGGNPHDFWGVWKEPRRPWIYGSDRNGGLYVFRLRGH